MRRVFFFMTVALVSVLSIDVSKMRKHSKADQKKLRGKKSTPAFDRRQYKEDSNGKQYCCKAECDAGAGILVEAPDGLNYCCKQDIDMDASRLTHERRFEDVDLATAVGAVSAATKTVDLLESAYYSKSKTIASLEAGVNLQKELEQEAKEALDAQSSRFAEERAVLASNKQTAEENEKIFGLAKAETEAQVEQFKAKKLSLETKVDQDALDLEEKTNLAESLERTLAERRVDTLALIAQKERQANELSHELQELNHFIAVYTETSRALGEQLAVTTEFTQKCIDAKEVQANQNKAAQATSKMAKEQMDAIKDDLDAKQKQVSDQMKAIEAKKAAFEAKIKEMEANADFNQHPEFLKLQDKMAAEIAKVDETHRQLAQKVTEMNTERDKVDRMVGDLNLADNSKGAMGDESPVTVRFRALRKKLQDKIKAMEGKCDRGATAEMEKLVVDTSTIKGCTDTNDCGSWKKNLDTTFKGIKNLADCMKSEYDELCGLMAEFKTQEKQLSTELDASKKRTQETVAKTNKDRTTFELDQKAALKAAEEADARIGAIQQLTKAAKLDLKFYQDQVKALEEQLEILGTLIRGVEDMILTSADEIRVAMEDYEVMKKMYEDEATRVGQQVANARSQVDELSILVQTLTQEVDDANTALAAAQAALGEDVNCEALAAMDCTKITEKAKCQAPDVAKHCVWQDSDDELSGGKKDTCRWIDEDSATAIMTKKLFNDDFTLAMFGISGSADDLEGEGASVGDKLDELIGTLNDFTIPEPPPIIDYGVEICSRVKGLNKGGCTRNGDGSFSFEGANEVFFDRNNFGCKGDIVCKTKGATECVPELTIVHEHTGANGKPASPMLKRFACRNYEFDPSKDMRNKGYVTMFAEKEFKKAATAKSGKAIPSWFTQENAGCLKYQTLGYSFEAVNSMASVLHTVDDLQPDMQCKMKGMFVKGTKSPQGFCEKEGFCWHRPAGVCRANYVLDLVMELLKNDEHYAVSEADAAKLRNKVCIEPPSDYSNDATVQIECGVDVCGGDDGSLQPTVATTKPTQSFSSVTGQKGSTGKKASPWVPGDPRTGVEVVKGVKKPAWKP
eukprot:g531.t1